MTETDKASARRRTSRLKTLDPDRRLGETLVEAAERLGGLGGGKDRASPAAVAVGQRIRAERQARGMTQTQLAERAGLAQSDVSNIERGGGADGPSIRVVSQIAEALGVSIPVGRPDVRQQQAVTIEGDEHVCVSNVPFSLIIPLLATSELEFMRKEVKELLREQSIGNARQWAHSHCTLLRVAHHGKVYKLSTSTEPVVIATFGGKASYRARGSFFRKELGGTCRGPIGILGNDSAVSVQTELGGDASLVIVPAGALLATTNEQPC